MESGSTRRDVHIGNLLRRAYRTHVRVVNIALKAVGMSSQHLYALIALLQNDGIDQTALSREMFLEKAALTPVIKALITAGHICRSSHPSDRRKILIFLTASGRSFARAHLETLSNIRDLSIYGLDDDELQVASRVLEQIIANLNSALESSE